VFPLAFSQKSEKCVTKAPETYVIATQGDAPATEVAGFGRAASLVRPRLDPDPRLPVVGSQVTRTGWQRATADGVGVSCSRLQSRPVVVRHRSRRSRYRAFVAMVEVFVFKQPCWPCKSQTAGIDQRPTCTCGEPMHRFAHAIRWVCTACKKSVPMDRCSCKETLFIRVGWAAGQVV
jgi:hypothetical protein